MHPGDRIKIKVKGQKGKRAGIVTSVKIFADTVGAPGQRMSGPRAEHVTVVMEPPEVHQKAGYGVPPKWCPKCGEPARFVNGQSFCERCGWQGEDTVTSHYGVPAEGDER